MGIEEDTVRIVTPEQFDDGYMELVQDKFGDAIRLRPYHLLRALPDGNFLVKQPGSERRERETQRWA